MDLAIQGFSALEDTTEMSQTLEEKKETFIKDLLQKSSIWSSSPHFTDRGKWRTWLVHHTTR